MPWGVAAAIGSAAVGSAVSSAMAPSTSGGSGGGPNYYIPTGLQNADLGWQGLQQSNLNEYYANAAPQMGYAYGAEQAGLRANTAYGGGYQNAANAAAQQYSNTAAAQNYGGNQEQAMGGALINQAGLNFKTQQDLLGAGYGVYQTAMDPQSALYNRTAQQLQEQTGATNSMYGLGSSAAGAGVANQAMSNFNIDWQNQQLQRQLQGLQGYTGAAGTAGGYGQLGTSQYAGAANQYAGAANMYQGAAGNMLQSGQLPYQTAQSISAVPGQLAGTYGSYLNSNLYGPAQSIQAQAIPYMNYGQGAQSIPYQQQMQGAGAAGALASQGVNAIGNNPQVQQTLGNTFQNFMNPATGSFGGGDFSGAFSSSPYYSGGGNSYGFTM